MTYFVSVWKITKPKSPNTYGAVSIAGVGEGTVICCSANGIGRCCWR